LTALVPVKNPVLTTREHPTFLFYVPYASDDVRFGEFSLLVGSEEKTRLYKTRFTLPQTPGIVSITLPSAPEYALEEGQYYHWYFELYCQSNTSSQPDVDVNGWVQRVVLTLERERQINAATPDVWYDASANLAQSLRASPQDARLKNDWLNLLKASGSEDLAQEPFVGSVIPSQQMSAPAPRRRREVIPSEELTRTFADWCLNKANLSRETLHTVDALLQVAKTQDCNQAEKLLLTRTSLSLNRNQIADLRPLSALTNLSFLDLSRNQIADLRPLSTLTNLSFLNLSRNQIANLRPLSALTNLIVLNLSDNKIANLRPLSTLTNLTDLNLGKNQIANIKSLSRLTKLTELYLYRNQIADLRPLSTLSTLSLLQLAENQIADLKPLSTLTRLYQLSLENNQITDLRPLSTLTNLYQLSLENNQIADLRPLSTLTNLTKFSLDRNQIADLKPLSTLTSLFVLSLDRNQIADLRPLSTLTNLIELSLENNQIADLRPLSTLTNLIELSLENNQIADLRPLSTLTYLSKLFLFNNQTLVDKTCPIKPISICIFVPSPDNMKLIF
jgi:internalin A